MWFSDSSILCKVHLAACPPSPSITLLRLSTLYQLRPGEGSSKTIEVDAFYSPHVQQQPQVRHRCFSMKRYWLDVDDLKQAGIDYARKFLDSSATQQISQEL
jgi:hypothetical protein